MLPNDSDLNVCHADSQLLYSVEQSGNECLGLETNALGLIMKVLCLETSALGLIMKVACHIGGHCWLAKAVLTTTHCAMVDERFIFVPLYF